MSEEAGGESGDHADRLDSTSTAESAPLSSSGMSSHPSAVPTPQVSEAMARMRAVDGDTHYGEAEEARQQPFSKPELTSLLSESGTARLSRHRFPLILRPPSDSVDTPMHVWLLGCLCCPARVCVYGMLRRSAIAVP